MELNNIDDVLEAQKRGELPKGVQAVDMRDAAFAVVVKFDGSVIFQYKCDLMNVVGALRELANELEVKQFAERLDDES